MKLSYFPQIKVIHVSKQYYGQVYIPFANWLLMIGTVVVTAVYTNVRYRIFLKWVRQLPCALANISIDY
jgi:hypothetical protein